MHQKLQKIFSIAIFIFMTHSYAEFILTSQPEPSNSNEYTSE